MREVFFREEVETPPPPALIGVAILFEEGILVEAEVTTVIDRAKPTRSPTRFLNDYPGQ